MQIWGIEKEKPIKICQNARDGTLEYKDINQPPPYSEADGLATSLPRILKTVNCAIIGGKLCVPTKQNI